MHRAVILKILLGLLVVCTGCNSEGESDNYLETPSVNSEVEYELMPLEEYRSRAEQEAEKYGERSTPEPSSNGENTELGPTGIKGEELEKDASS
ncbi:hypothetical protein B0H94_102189 [Salsuginibacillus halophilus]|uniref:Uncharacterized protein n=1 Tax=Salsuginibacillus halophilus TaxID=517424 RepID=A0A2P8HXG3_9BACI|nr:hypothetical protein [Salsuginibacillus halophilus]PSL50912.1 hypothetical protein B0H94_102189 [Salsuginibacillus halophilus]